MQSWDVFRMFVVKSYKPLMIKTMRATSVSFYEYAVSDADRERVKESLGNMDSLFDAIKSIPYAFWLKMEGFNAVVLDFNSYPVLSVRFSERFQDPTILRLR